jgi:tryptophan synthase beta chain
MYNKEHKYYIMLYYLQYMEIPERWYNMNAVVKADPPKDAKTGEVIKPEALSALFAKELIKQEMSDEIYIRIPDEVREVYEIWRPTPLVRAKRLESALKTPAKIFYKWEGVSPPGSHKPNTAVAQAYYNAKEGIERLATETGAGQWGSALAFACMHFGLKCTVYMVSSSYEQKPYRKTMMHLWGADIFKSPSERTEFGRRMLSENPETSGSLGIAISEAVEDAVNSKNTHYSLGSVLNHVLLHQSVIGLEAKSAFESMDLYPDIIAGCVGGGSNFGGLIAPFVGDKKKGKDVRFIASEPIACPSLTKGVYAYDFGDAAGLTPALKMYTLGHTYVPPAIHAGGLRYHGASPIISKLVNTGTVEKRAYPQSETFQAAKLFAQTEGYIIAPESAHALRCVIEEAIKCKEKGEEKVILFNNSGHGLLDLGAYESFLDGKLKDCSPEIEVRGLPEL